MNDAWVNWLARTGYGFDHRTDELPPVSAEELARAYMRMWEHDGTLSEDDTVENTVWLMGMETGVWL